MTGCSVLQPDAHLAAFSTQMTGLSESAKAGQFHGPATIGSIADSTLALPVPVKSPLEGQATLTPAQAADLLSGKWYINITTSTRPRGEIRGQMILRE